MLTGGAYKNFSMGFLDSGRTNATLAVAQKRSSLLLVFEEEGMKRIVGFPSAYEQEMYERKAAAGTWLA